MFCLAWSNFQFSTHPRTQTISFSDTGCTHRHPTAGGNLLLPALQCQSCPGTAPGSRPGPSTPGRVVATVPLWRAMAQTPPRLVLAKSPGVWRQGNHPAESAKSSWEQPPFGAGGVRAVLQAGDSSSLVFGKTIANAITVSRINRAQRANATVSTSSNPFLVCKGMKLLIVFVLRMHMSSQTMKISSLSCLVFTFILNNSLSRNSSVRSLRTFTVWNISLMSAPGPRWAHHVQPQPHSNALPALFVFTSETWIYVSNKHRICFLFLLLSPKRDFTAYCILSTYSDPSWNSSLCWQHSLGLEEHPTEKLISCRVK